MQINNVDIQAQLVSGTNIKTVNNISVLGNGNVPVGGIHNLLPTFGFTNPQHTQAVFAVGAQTYNTAANRLNFTPYYPANTVRCVQMQVQVNTGVAASLMRILIYSDNGGIPGTKLFESTSIDTSTTGIKTITLSFTFEKSTVYWITYHYSAASVVIQSFTSASVISIYQQGGTVYNSLITSTYTFGSAPAAINWATAGISPQNGGVHQCWIYRT